MIVASILLAFAIDAAWAQRQVRGEEQVALAALEAEFTANLTQIERVMDVYRTGRENLATLSAATPAELRALPQRSISKIMLATASVWTFDPVLGATDARAGNLELNSALRLWLEDGDSLTVDQANVAWAWEFSTLRHFENIHRQAELGVLPLEDVDRRLALHSNFDSPRFAARWIRTKIGFSPSFVAYLDDYLSRERSATVQ